MHDTTTTSSSTSGSASASGAIDLAAIEPLARFEAVELGRQEYARFADMAAALEATDWMRPTDCEGWTVHDVVAHLCGAMMTATAIRRQIAEQVKFTIRAKRDGVNEVDAMTAIQIEKVADLRPDELVERMRSLVDDAAAGRARMPDPIARAMKFRVVMNSLDERWSLSYLLGPILTRDTWLHRVNDVARAIDTTPALTADHDGRIVADVAAEWARRHGEPVTLVLTGPAGGRFRAGQGGPTIELDAVDFARAVSRRAPAIHPLLETEVPF